MAKISFKKAAHVIAIAVLGALGIFPNVAQPYFIGTFDDPEVLVSHGPSPDYDSGQNMETTLVNIKAVDAPALHSVNGKIGMGSEQRYGQGIIIDSSGIIVTNRHITNKAQQIYVMLSSGETCEASVILNSKSDLCLLKINTSIPLRAISLADTSEIQIGKNVIAITNAGFSPQRVVGGQIVKIFKENNSNKVELLEINLTLNPGDSGGPILNQAGALLGLIMGKQLSDPSKSYAIASNRIQEEYFKYRNSMLN